MGCCVSLLRSDVPTRLALWVCSCENRFGKTPETNSKQRHPYYMSNQKQARGISTNSSKSIRFPVCLRVRIPTKTAQLVSATESRALVRLDYFEQVKDDLNQAATHWPTHFNPLPLSTAGTQIVKPGKRAGTFWPKDCNKRAWQNGEAPKRPGLPRRIPLKNMFAAPQTRQKHKKRNDCSQKNGFPSYKCIKQEMGRSLHQAQRQLRASLPLAECSPSSSARGGSRPVEMGMKFEWLDVGLFSGYQKYMNWAGGGEPFVLGIKNMWLNLMSFPNPLWRQHQPYKIHS